MTARCALLLAALLAASCVTAWAQPGPFTITPASLPVGGGVFVVGQAIPTQQFAPSPSLDEAFAWSVSSGTLPPGLVFDTVAATLTGTPTQGGAFTFTVFSQELSTNFTASQQYTVYVSTGTLTLTPLTHPSAAVGTFYLSPTFQVGGGVPGYTWALQSGTNSDGLTVNSGSGQLAGGPLAGGVFLITLVVSDAAGAQVSGTLNLNVLGITTAALPNGALGTPYSQTLVAAGNSGTLIWALSGSGTLPPGLTLGQQGQITGTPTATGAFPFQVRAIDSVTNLSTTKSLSINIPAQLTITTTSLPNGTVGAAYSQTLAATGAAGSPTWVLSGSGVLPPGLSLSAQGRITGAPTQTGVYPFQVQATDPVTSLTATQPLSLTITAAVGISPATLPNGVVNVPYPATTLTVAGVAISSWAVTAGTLPAGLTLNAVTGIISGTPTVVGSSTFTISATPGAVVAALPPVVQQFTLSVTGTPSVVISGLPSVGVAATQSAAAVSLSGGTYPLLITGTMTLAFAPATGGSQNYDAKFATGTGSTVNFTIPTGTAQGLFGTASSVPVIIGTVAGTITITTTLQDSNGTALTPPAPIVITVNPTVPVVIGITPGAVTSSGFSISVTGRSTPRNMTSALFHFTAPTGTQLASADVTVPLTSAFTTWYNSSNSIPFGSTFAMTVQFSFTGPPGETVPYTTVTVTLTNSVGASTASAPVSP